MMNHRVNSKKRVHVVHIVLYVCAALAVGSMLFYTLALSKWTYHSDCAAYLFLAQEQAATGQFFPDGFHYTTEIFGFTPNLTTIPWLGLFSNQLLIHELGVITYALICIACIWILLWDRKPAAALTTIFLTIPYSYSYRDMLFFQGAYLNSILMLTLSLLGVKLVFQLKTGSGRTRKILSWVAFCAFELIVNLYSLRNYLNVTLPVLCALGCMVLIRQKGIVRHWFREKQLMSCIFVTVGLALVNLFGYKMLTNALNFTTQIGQDGLVSLDRVINNLEVSLCTLLNFFGFEATASLLSIHTIVSCLCVVFAAIIIVIFPILAIRYILKIEDKFMQFVCLFAVFENFFTLFMMVFCGYSIDRYYIPAMFSIFVALSMCLTELTRRYRKMIGNWLYILPMCFCLCMEVTYYDNIPNWWYNQPIEEMITNPKIDTDLDEFFDEHDLDYGFATFWHAYQNMAYINNSATIVAYDRGKPKVPYYFDENDPENPQYYAIAEHYYDVEKHPGRCFVMVYPGESIPDEYYQVAEEVIVREDFTCLIFEKNIYLYDELP